jgi:hypothetical protein
MGNHPLRERGVWVRLKRPSRVALTFLAVAVPFAGCGGGGDGDDRPTVAAGLQHYFTTFHPEDSIFPTGAGPPRVKNNGCKDLHRKFPLVLQPGTITRPGSIMMSKGEQKRKQTVALWQCFVRFKNFTVTVHVVVYDSNEVVWAVPVYGRKAPRLSPARTYTG